MAEAMIPAKNEIMANAKELIAVSEKRLAKKIDALEKKLLARI